MESEEKWSLSFGHNWTTFESFFNLHVFQMLFLLVWMFEKYTISPLKSLRNRRNAFGAPALVFLQSSFSVYCIIIHRSVHSHNASIYTDDVVINYEIWVIAKSRIPDYRVIFFWPLVSTALRLARGFTKSKVFRNYRKTNSLMCYYVNFERTRIECHHKYMNMARVILKSSHMQKLQDQILYDIVPCNICNIS